jgi:hypothetical protein
VRLLLVLAVAVAAGDAVAQPDSPPRATPGLAQVAEPPVLTPELAGAPPAEEAPVDRRGGWRHALGLGAHLTALQSKEGSHYTFISGSIGYLGSVGTTGGFLNAFFLFPLQARQDGQVYSTGAFYRSRTGAELLLGAEHRWAFGRDLELEAGPGLHGTFINLPGKQGYRDFSAFPLGIGASGVLRFATRGEALHRTVTVDAYASVAYDFTDPAHSNDLAHGFVFHVGVGVGLGALR